MDHIPASRRRLRARHLLGCLLAAAPLLSFGDPGADAGQARAWRVVVEGGYDRGLSDAAWLTYPDGRQQRLAANGGLRLAAGALVALGAGRDWELQGTVGWKTGGIGPPDEGLRFQAFPCEVLASRLWPRWRLSAGASLALGPRVEASSTFGYQARSYQAALGLLAQADVLATDPASGARASLGVRFDWKTLVANDGGPGTRASAIGVTTGIAF